VDQLFGLMRATFLGDDRAEAPADPVRAPVRWASSSVPEVCVSSGPSSWRGTVATACVVSPSRTQLVIRLVALIWALTLGHTSIAGSFEAREDAPGPKGPDLATTVDGVVSDSHTHVAQSEHGSHGRSLKRHGTRSKVALWHNPDCDDETSKDSDDDDDTANDLNVNDDETDVPIIFWLQDRVHYLISLEAESAPAWTETPYSPFPTQQRLRC
jgi:hypothetical protein